MHVVTIDFETYYDQDYSLSKMSTAQYIRDPRFEVIGVGVQVDDGPQRWYEEFEFRVLAAATDFSDKAILCHHTQFDGAILAWRYGVKPKAWLDTLSMARAVVGGRVRSYSLDALATHFEVGTKGKEVLNAKGKRRADFTPAEWAQYGNYCKNDVALTYRLYLQMVNGFHALMQKQIERFPLSELKLIDRHIRMFTEPTIVLDTILLKATLADTKFLKEEALANAGVDKADLMSNPKFAEVLRSLGVEPPMKISATTGKETFAFAKTDAGMTELAEHPDPRVQAVVAARLKNKSTLMETRLESLLASAQNGPLPVYLKYYGADQTGRTSGGDGNNMQNNPRGSPIRQAMLAPDGHVFVVVDSSNIEARGLNMLAGQESTIEVFKKNDAGLGPDVYCIMAGSLYGRLITKADKPERQHGKLVVLGCGYGMSGSKFAEVARQQKVKLSGDEAQVSVDTYRSTHPRVVALWKRAGEAIEWMYRGQELPIDPAGIVWTVRDGIRLPNGLIIKYPNLRKGDDGWVYDSGRAIGVRLYGGKVVENIVQALARIIVMEQTEVIAKKFGLVLTVHDEGVFAVRSEIAKAVLDFAVKTFATSPAWWPGIPLNAEGDISISYGAAK